MINSYFDLLKVLGKPAYENVSASDKGRHIFMVNRHLTRLYPEISASFSHLKTDPVMAMDFWNTYFKAIYSAKKDPLPPKINFAKLTPPKKQKSFDEECLLFMINKLRLGSRDLAVLKKLKEDELIKYLNEIDELINEKVKK